MQLGNIIDAPAASTTLSGMPRGPIAQSRAAGMCRHIDPQTSEVAGHDDNVPVKLKKRPNSRTFRLDLTRLRRGRHSSSPSIPFQIEWVRRIEGDDESNVRELGPRPHSAAEPQNQPGCFGAAGLMAKILAEKQRFQPQRCDRDRACSSNQLAAGAIGVADVPSAGKTLKRRRMISSPALLSTMLYSPAGRAQSIGSEK